MNNTKTLYLSSRLDRLSLEKDEPISSLNSKISTERDGQYFSIHTLIITKPYSIPTLPVMTDRTVQSTMLSITKLYVNQLMHIHNYYKASKIGIGVPLQTSLQNLYKISVACTYLGLYLYLCPTNLIQMDYHTCRECEYKFIFKQT